MLKELFHHETGKRKNNWASDYELQFCFQKTRLTSGKIKNNFKKITRISYFIFLFTLVSQYLKVSMFYLGDIDLFVLNKACQKYGTLDYLVSPVRGFQNSKFFAFIRIKLATYCTRKIVLWKPVFIQPIFQILCI